MAPRWRKALADVVARPGRSALAVLAMAVGVGAIATLAFKEALIRPVLATMYGATDPASATFFVDSLDDALIDAVRGVAGVGDVEARPVIMAKLRVGRPGEEVWVPAFLYAIHDFEAQRLNRVKPGRGPWPPGDGEVLLERSALQVAGAGIGDDLPLRIPGGGDRTLRLAGTVHAAGLAPAWMEHVVYGFIPWTSAVRQGPHRESAQLLMRVADHPLEEGHIHEVADRVRAELEARGRTVRRVAVPVPGRHPHAGQMNAFLYLLGTFGVFAFLLSAVMVAGMVHTLQSEQVRQVGVMKAIGATRRQITGVYLAHVGILAAGALCLGVPAGWVAGGIYARFSAGIFNVDIGRSPFPWTTLLGLAVVGVAVPVAAAMIPVWRAARITVREALADHPGARPFGEGRLERRLARITWLPRPLVLVLRAAVQHRARLALTVGMLAIGGGMFMSARNVSAGWERAAALEFDRRRYDLIVFLAQPEPVEEVDRLLAGLPAVAHVENWPSESVYLIGPSGAPGKPVTLLGVDPASRLIVPRITSGRWLDAAAPRGVVINHGLLALYPGLTAGDSVGVRIDGRTVTFPIAGVVKELLPQPIVYVPVAAMLEATGQTGGTVRIARVVTREHGAEAERAAARQIDEAFQARGIETASIYRKDDMRGAVLDHLVIVKFILTLAAAIVVLVGAIGLTSALAISVVQRTRELGVMSAVGATPRTLAFLVWCEAMLLALVSWFGACVVSLPVTWVMEGVAGRLFFETPLDFTVSGGAVAAWLALVVALAGVSSVHPALRAARLTVREAIAHV